MGVLEKESMPDIGNDHTGHEDLAAMFEAVVLREIVDASQLCNWFRDGEVLD
jgi:hypothetical protein